MRFNKRQKQFAVVASIAAVITIASHVNVLGLAFKPYPKSPDSAQVALVANSKQSASTPEEIGRGCLPDSESAGAELIGEYQNPISTELFQVWRLSIAQHPVLRVHGLFGETCLLAYDSRYNNSLGDDLSQEDAQQIALVIHRHRADELGGVEALQADLDAQAAELTQYGETGYLPAESIWALEELGINIPDVYEVYDPENPPQMSRPSRGEV